MSLNRIYNRLGGFSCSRVAGRGPWFLCLIAPGSATENCFLCFRCRFGRVACGDGDRPGRKVVGKVSQSIVSIGFIHISFTFDNLFLTV